MGVYGVIFTINEPISEANVGTVKVCYFYDISLYFTNFFTLHYGLADSSTSLVQLSLSRSQGTGYRSFLSTQPRLHN